MLNYNILDLKPTFYKEMEDGTKEEMKDLFAKTYAEDEVISSTLLIVTKDYECRPDLISLAVYKTDEYADIICKYNNISNPFDLNVGMVLYIPTIDNIQKLLNRPTASTARITENDKIGQIREDFKKKIDETRSPNEQTINNNNYFIDKVNNLVFY